MTRSIPKAAPAASSAHPAKTPAVPTTTKRLRKPSITTPLVAATLTDHPPVVQIPAVTVASVTSATTPPPTSVGVPAPPDVATPTPASGFFAEPLRAFSGCYPSKPQLAAMAGAISDLEGFADAADVLGPLAPPATSVVEALEVALQWRAMRDPSATWDEYVRTMDGRAWKAAMTLLDELKPLFQLAMTKNADLAKQYPGLAQLFDAPKATAKQALATKRKKAKENAKGAVTPVAEAAGTTPAAPVAAGASPRTVTVTG